MTTEQTLARIETILERIAQALENQTSHQFQYTPEGNPICPRHNVPMRKREKQGDTWYSHTVTDPVTGESLYCRGYASKNSPGWNIVEEVAEQPRRQQARQVQQPRQAQPQPRRSVTPSPSRPVTPSPDLDSAIRELKGGQQ